MDLLIFALTLGLLLSVVDSNYQTAENYRGESIAQIRSPRGLSKDSVGDILVVSDQDSAIYVLYENDKTFESKVILTAPLLRLTHGISYHDGFIYASSASTVYKWKYTAGSREAIIEPHFIVINGIPSEGHFTRTILFNDKGDLLVSIGSEKNVDPNSDRARILQFNLNNAQFPIEFKSGKVLVDGVRNTVGLGYDLKGILWGVDNSGTDLFREDLGGDIHNGNPGDELNAFKGSNGQNFGYPYCFSSGDLKGHPPGTQFVWPDFQNDDIHSDEWCRNTANNAPPTLVFPAHVAPLDIQFYNGEGCDESDGSFPCSSKGNAFVTFHGSWNSDTKVGYKVVEIPFSEKSEPSEKFEDLVRETNLNNCGESPNQERCFRPVNSIFTPKGHLVISDDGRDEIIRITRKPNDSKNSGNILMGRLCVLIVLLGLLI